MQRKLNNLKKLNFALSLRLVHPVFAPYILGKAASAAILPLLFVFTLKGSRRCFTLSSGSCAARC